MATVEENWHTSGDSDIAIYTSFLRDYASGTCSASDCKSNGDETRCEG